MHQESCLMLFIRAISARAYFVQPLFLMIPMRVFGGNPCRCRQERCDKLQVVDAIFVTTTPHFWVYPAKNSVVMRRAVARIAEANDSYAAEIFAPNWCRTKKDKARQRCQMGTSNIVWNAGANLCVEKR